MSNTPEASAAELLPIKSLAVEIAASLHRAKHKYYYDYLEGHKPTAKEARQLLTLANSEMHSIGNQAIKLKEMLDDYATRAAMPAAVQSAGDASVCALLVKGAVQGWALKEMPSDLAKLIQGAIQSHTDAVTAEKNAETARLREALLSTVDALEETDGELAEKLGQPRRIEPRTYANLRALANPKQGGE